MRHAPILEGLSEREVTIRRAGGQGNRLPSQTGRTYWQIVRDDVFPDEPTMRFTERYMQVTGYLDSRSMGLLLNLLRANELVRRNVINNYLLGKEPPAFDILFWNSDGTRVVKNAHTFYLREFVLENRLVKPGELLIKGVPIDDTAGEPFSQASLP